MDSDSLLLATLTKIENEQLKVQYLLQLRETKIKSTTQFNYFILRKQCSFSSWFTKSDFAQEQGGFREFSTIRSIP